MRRKLLQEKEFGSGSLSSLIDQNTETSFKIFSDYDNIDDVEAILKTYDINYFVQEPSTSFGKFTFVCATKYVIVKKVERMIKMARLPVTVRIEA